MEFSPRHCAADISVVTGGDVAGYDFKICDDDDELYLLSKQDHGDSNRFKTAAHGREGQNNIHDGDERN